ncbi:RsmE family RNA methyltransferase [Blautia sp.]|uniref:RsmE family RNA methyltransferase n=1 Tax=Blautia sp. TaxID=1955243 RepID=UPI002E76EC14|nr:16S rRNA (uracil(1498)-N(3))-methyltransferase [Blautia sp.]MEE0811193.1 16S rRNA (uracil(1498)-N(3))-methyltransferase [Blautia sp.]
MYRFFVEPEQVGEKEITITGSDVNHIKNVLRMKPEETILISSGESLEYTCYIRELKEEEIIAHIMYVQESGYELLSRLYLFQGLPKSDKMELIIQKAVELGVHEIIPVASKRAVVKLDARKEEKKRTRWQAISESAAKQSKRMYVPEVRKVMSFSQAVEYAGQLDVVLVPYELAKGMGETREIIGKIKKGQSVGIFIGPEGGFEEAEVELAVEKANAKAITLGKRILRTETAGLTVLSILMFTLEEE